MESLTHFVVVCLIAIFGFAFLRGLLGSLSGACQAYDEEAASVKKMHQPGEDEYLYQWRDNNGRVHEEVM